MEFGFEMLILKNLRWRITTVLKIEKNRHISATVRPIFTKFGKTTRTGSLNTFNVETSARLLMKVVRRRVKTVVAYVPHLADCCRLYSGEWPTSTSNSSRTCLNVYRCRCSLANNNFNNFTINTNVCTHTFPDRTRMIMLSIAWGNLDPLLCSSLGPLESSTQTASRLVQPFLHGSPRLTDDAIRPV